MMAAWAAATGGAVVAVLAGVAPLGAGSEVTNAAGQSRRSDSATLTRYHAESLGTIIVARDLFRVARRPSAVAYDPVRGALPAVPQVPRPHLTLVGLVVGHPPSAVIEGFPGVEGSRVVRPGDVVAGLRVTRIEGGATTIVGLDTTWVLRVRRPWQ